MIMWCIVTLDLRGCINRHTELEVRLQRHTAARYLRGHGEDRIYRSIITIPTTAIAAGDRQSSVRNLVSEHMSGFHLVSPFSI